MVFPVVMYGCESWTIKKAEHRRIDAFELWLEKTLESPLDCKEIQPVHSKGDQPWVFFGGNDAKAETPVPIYFIIAKIFMASCAIFVLLFFFTKPCPTFRAIKTFHIV